MCSRRKPSPTVRPSSRLRGPEWLNSRNVHSGGSVLLNRARFVVCTRCSHWATFVGVCRRLHCAQGIVIHPPVPQRSGYFGGHLEPEGRVPLGPVRHEVQEIPLRHEDDVLAGGWEVAEIDEIERLAFKSDAQLLDGLVRDLAQELIEYSKLMHQIGG